MDQKKTGALIRVLRLEKGLTQQGLAELLDAVMAYLLGEPVREGPRPGAVRFVSRLF